MTGTKKTRDVGMKAHEVTSYNLRSEDPAEHEAHLDAWQRFADSQPKDEPGDGPFDALRRQNAERCREIIRKEGLGDLLESDGRVNTFTLRTRGFDEASAGWIAAKWLNSYHHLQDCRANLINGDTGVENVATMIEQAEELGKLQERLWWRCGVDEETQEKREALAVRERAVNLGRKGGGAQNKQKAKTDLKKAHSIARVICKSRVKPITKSDLFRRIIDKWDGEKPPSSKTLYRYFKGFPNQITAENFPSHI